MEQIAHIQARQILDSRGNPTIEVDLYTSGGIIARSSVPSGASTGKYEAIELRDGNNDFYLGKSVQKAIDNINKTINEELNGLDVTDQSSIDSLMINLDGTENKSNLGANAILGVSLAAARAGSISSGQPLFRYIGGINANLLPIPMMNIINGGAHSNNKLDIQEFMIMPIEADNFAHAVRMGAEIYHNLKNILALKNYSINVGDEGGFAPDLKSNEEALDLILSAIEKAGYKPGENVFLALDAAASQFYNEKKKEYQLHGSKKALKSSDLVNYWKKLVSKYPIISIEDGFGEDDWEGWKMLNAEIGHQIQLVGDDLFVTNFQRLQQGIIEGAANAILIKPNQIGTISETIATVQLANHYSFNTIISHRSGETEDTTIADLAVALNSGIIKIGAPCRTDRVVKYNQLLRIEETLGGSARYLGKAFKYVP